MTQSIIDVGLSHPRSNGLVGDLELARNLGHEFARAADQARGFSSKFGRIRSSRSGHVNILPESLDL